MTMDIAYVELTRFGAKEITIFKTRAENSKAKLARELVIRWGMVAASPDGEDKAGRQKSRLARPEEIVLRACETAELLVTKFEELGWLLDLPAPSQEEEDTK